MNGYIHNREELKPIHDEVASWAERSFVIGGIAHHKQQDLEQRIAKHVDPMLARIKELEEALKALLEDGIGTAYDNQDDDVGYHTCCRTISYEPHAADCPAEHARAILNKR